MKEADWALALWYFLENNYDQTVLVGQERRLWDNTRVDILTQSWAVEIDYAPKWAEAIGQSLYYAAMTNRQPGIVLLMEDFNRDIKYYYRCKIACPEIKIWMVDTLKRAVIDFDNKRYKI